MKRRLESKFLRASRSTSDSVNSELPEMFASVQYIDQPRNTRLQASSRTALWQSKKRLDEQEQKMRQELFGGLGKDGKSFTEQYELRQRRDRGY